MTTEAPTTTAPPPPSGEKPTPPPPPRKQRSKPRIAIGVAVLLVVIGTYALSLFGVHQLQEAEAPLPPLDLSQGGGDATIVQLRL